MTRSQTNRKVRVWLRDELKDIDEVSVADLSERAAEHFSNDTAFVKSFLAEHLQGLLYALALDVVAQTRGPVIQLGDRIVSTAAFQAKAAQRRESLWGSWLEHAGDRHVRLLAANSNDLLLAASERRSRGRHEFTIAATWEKLVEGMHPQQLVGERYQIGEIDAIHQAIVDSYRQAQSPA